MRRMLSRLGWTTLALFLITPLATAQIGRLQGRVIGEDGKPVEGAEIEITQISLDKTQTLKTRGNGRFMHAGLPADVYRVACVIDGDVKAVKQVRVLYRDTTDVEFDLGEARLRSEALRTFATTGEFTEEQRKGLSRDQLESIQEEAVARAAEFQENEELDNALNTGMQAKQNRQWDVAVENLQRAYDIFPQQTMLLENLALSYIQKAKSSQGPESEEALAAAFAPYDTLRAANPGDAEVERRYALALYMAGRYDEGNAALETAMGLASGAPGMSYYELGDSLMEIHSANQDAACTAYAKAAEVGKEAMAYLKHGNCLMNQMSMNADGTVVPAPGTREAFETFLDKQSNGPEADAARQALQVLDSTVQTEVIQN